MCKLWPRKVILFPEYNMRGTPEYQDKILSLLTMGHRIQEIKNRLKNIRTLKHALMPDQQLTEPCTQSGGRRYISGELLRGQLSEVIPFVSRQDLELLY